MFDLDGSQFRANLLLAALPVADYQRILPSLEAVPLKVRDFLYERYQPIEYVYFPLNGLASILVALDRRTFVEAAIVGGEGMVGLPVFMGASMSNTFSFYQIPGVAVRMRADLFRAEIQRNGVLASITQRYANAFMLMLTQNIACNIQHTVEERCARWLLLTHERVGKDEFLLTQDLIGQMLGERRAGVNLVMQTLQKAGLIHYDRGVIRILDRMGLESVACQCLGVITAAYQDLRR
jgi:CRP-like cAMP-binding protein